jgi:hypothetical protein
MKMSKVYQKNNSEGARNSRRKWQAKNAKNDAVWPDTPLGTLLLEISDEFKDFVNHAPLYTGGKYPQTKTLRQILNQHPSSYCVLDTAATPAPWPQIRIPANSNHPRDLGMFSLYSIKHQWAAFYRKTKSYNIRINYDDQGRFVGVDGVHWRVLRWRGGRNSWKNAQFTISDDVLPELEAFQLLCQLTQGLEVIEFGKAGGIDVLRINGMIDMLQLPRLSFFNLGYGITYMQYGSATVVFGSHGLIPTPSAQVQNITDRLFDLTDTDFVPLEDIPHTNEPPLDVQREWNLLMYYRYCYHF